MSNRSQYYILSEGNPLPCDEQTWVLWFSKHYEERICERTKIGEIIVLTMFLGLDHNSNPNDQFPLIFETIIFGGEHDQAMWYDSTLEQARARHTEACQLVISGVKGREHLRIQQQD